MNVAIKFFLKILENPKFCLKDEEIEAIDGDLYNVVQKYGRKEIMSKEDLPEVT